MNPTMKKSSKAGAEESGRNLALIQQFKYLENEWESLKKCKKPLKSRFSTGSADNSSQLTISFDSLLENSPRGLMKTLQQRIKSPNSDGFFRASRNCDAAVEEILRDRRAAIMSGKVRGRRIFAAAEVEVASEVELELDYDDCGGDGGNVDENLINENCEDGLISDLTEEKEVVEKRRGGGGGGGGGRSIMAMASLAFLLVLVICGIVSINCNGKSVNENEWILVPT